MDLTMMEMKVIEHGEQVRNLIADAREARRQAESFRLQRDEALAALRRYEVALTGLIEKLCDGIEKAADALDQPTVIELDAGDPYVEAAAILASMPQADGDDRSIECEEICFADKNGDFGGGPIC
jgi:hypothetical protein